MQAVPQHAGDTHFMSQASTPTASARNAEIRRLRALPPGERPSLADLAAEHNLSRERIRQIECGQSHPKASGRRRYGEIELVTQGKGRYEVIINRDGTPQCAGLVLGGQRRWTLERPRYPDVHADSIAKLAARVAQDSGIQ